MNTDVRDIRRQTTRVNPKPQNRPIAKPKLRNRFSPKLAYAVTSWILPGMQTFVAIGSVVSAPRIRFLVRFFGGGGSSNKLKYN